MAEKKLDEERVNSSEEAVETQNVNNVTIDDNLKEILKKLQKEKKVSKEELEKLKKEAYDSVNFVEKIDQINLDFNKYVIFTDGNEQLVYEDGEFYVVSSTDATQKREKKKKEEAKNMYLEYFIRFVLNPIIKQRDINEHSKGIASPTVQKELKEVKRKISQKSKVKEQETDQRIPKKENNLKKKEDVEIEIDSIDM